MMAKMTANKKVYFKGDEFETVPTILCDFYKISHRIAYPKGTEVIYSNFVPRSTKYLPQADGIIVFGIQAFIKEYLMKTFQKYFFELPKEVAMQQYREIIGASFDIPDENVDVSHLEALHDLGYLPLSVKAIKEGTLVPVQTPVLTIENTVDGFHWLTNYLETLISTELWQPMTSATQAYAMRKLLNDYALLTTGDKANANFQMHDFSMRGMPGVHAGEASSAAHLIFSYGTDTVSAIQFLRRFYNAVLRKENIGSSIPATEHSVMCANTDLNEDEYETIHRFITETFPEGFISIVSDTYDFWKIVTVTLPRLYNEIMNRPGRVVIRPDSGVPEDILCGLNTRKDFKENLYDISMDSKYIHAKQTISALKGILEDYIVDGLVADSDNGMFIYEFKVKTLDNVYYKIQATIPSGSFEVENATFEITMFENQAEIKGLIECLWETFGGIVNQLGFKVLDDHIGAIYGDSITYNRAKEIAERLMEKGFASTNVVYGVGSFTYQYVTRDSAGMAMKAVAGKFNGVEKALQKAPKTDMSKKSLTGRAIVIRDENNKIITIDGLNSEQEATLAKEKGNLLVEVFRDGSLLQETSLSEIRATANQYV